MFFCGRNDPVVCRNHIPENEMLPAVQTAGNIFRRFTLLRLTKEKTEEFRMQTNWKLPKIGMRNIKTAITAALCALIYYFIGRSPAFACIGVIFGIAVDATDGYKNGGGNRLYGTIIGGLVGMVLFRLYLFFVPDGSHTPLLVLFTFVGVIVLIWVCNLFWQGGVQPGGVVLCIVLFNTPVETYVAYSLNRILDTSVGVLMALLVNWLFPMGWREIWPRRLQAFQEKLSK